MLREIQQKMMNAKVSIIWITYKIMICLQDTVDTFGNIVKDQYSHLVYPNSA